MNEIICGDCIELMKQMDSNTVDLIFTSPPYNTGGKGKNKGLYKFYDDNLTDDSYFNLLRDSMLEAMRICRGLSFFNLSYMTNNKKVLFSVFADLSDYIKELVVWDKMRVQPPIGNILGKRYEFILVLSSNPKFEINNFRENKASKYTKEFGCWISNLIQLSSQRKPVKFHQAVFPTQLPSIFIDIYTKPNNIILDPFCGSGTTCVAAKELGRNYIGIDISEEYCSIARSRLEAATEKPTNEAVRLP